jgi:hypothetical protein
VDALQRYVTFALIALVLAWSLRFHGWWRRDRRRRRSALWGGFSTSLMSLSLLITGVLGIDVTRRGFLIRESAWTGSVIWFQVMAGLALLPLAGYLLRRGVRAIARQLQQQSR